jgi:hypothetical protein
MYRTTRDYLASIKRRIVDRLIRPTTSIYDQRIAELAAEAGRTYGPFDGLLRLSVSFLAVSSMFLLENRLKCWRNGPDLKSSAVSATGNISTSCFDRSDFYK